MPWCLLSPVLRAAQMLKWRDSDPFHPSLPSRASLLLFANCLSLSLSLPLATPCSFPILLCQRPTHARTHTHMSLPDRNSGALSELLGIPTAHDSTDTHRTKVISMQQHLDEMAALRRELQSDSKRREAKAEIRHELQLARVKRKSKDRTEPGASTVSIHQQLHPSPHERHCCRRLRFRFAFQGHS